MQSLQIVDQAHLEVILEHSQDQMTLVEHHTVQSIADLQMIEVLVKDVAHDLLHWHEHQCTTHHPSFFLLCCLSDLVVQAHLLAVMNHVLLQADQQQNDHHCFCADKSAQQHVQQTLSLVCAQDDHNLLNLIQNCLHHIDLLWHSIMCLRTVEDLKNQLCLCYNSVLSMLWGSFVKGHSLDQWLTQLQTQNEVLMLMLVWSALLHPLLFLQLRGAEIMSQLTCSSEFLQIYICQVMLKVNCIFIDLIVSVWSVKDLSVKDIQHCGLFQIILSVVVIIDKIDLNEILESVKLLDHNSHHHLMSTLHIDVNVQHCFDLRCQHLCHSVLCSDLCLKTSQILEDILWDGDFHLESDAEGLDQDQVAHRSVKDISHDQKFVVDQDEEHIAVMHKEIALVAEFVASSHV